ncbi:T9SS type A sorting domain-containing protein [Longitalea luteola]|uniref:T9SS type A sorting domain-containing protein n=1 Tax=Longitalea luteola TaxID=2812563 RepID=UPI001A978260|nr:T9SS type A sorting domain-containing protein [Longitalea luteola]
MKKFLTFCLLLICTISSSKLVARPFSMSGVYPVGPAGTYPTITAAVNALRAASVSGAVILELQAGYKSTGELFPLTFHGIQNVDASRTITIRPAAGAANLVITSGNDIATVDLNNARYIHFDGRPGGMGTARQLSIINTYGTAVRFINGASDNGFHYVQIQSSRTSGEAKPIVHFSTSVQAITTGNNNNIIQNSAISGNGSLFAGIYSLGTIAKKNSSNKLLNNLIFNYGSNGVRLEENSDAWEISGNSFYHTTGSISRNVGIYVNDTTSSAFVITDNFIGGSAANCGGAPRDYYTSYSGIQLSTGTSSYTSIQNNTIANVRFGAASFGDYFAGIYLMNGKFKCGDIAGNIIGSQSTTGNITIAARDSHIEAFGIVTGTGYDKDSGIDTCYIRNNKIGGFYGGVSNTTVYPPELVISGIYMRYQKKGYAELVNNTVGSPSLYNSISINSKITTQHIYGIRCENYDVLPSSAFDIISNNLIANLSGNTTGIYVDELKALLMNNTIRHIYDTLSAYAMSVTTGGIDVRSLAGNSVVSGNTIHSLSTVGSGTISQFGIRANRCEHAVITKNFIHSLQCSGSSSTICGLQMDAGYKMHITNNMVRLGVDADGRLLSGDHVIKGIVLQPMETLISHNSVWLGGTGDRHSAALELLPTSTMRSRIRNNIFVNTRSANGSLDNYHYAINALSAGIDENEINYNIYYVSGKKGLLGYYPVYDFTKEYNYFSTLMEWRKRTHVDSNSIFYNPNFVNATGNAASVDLHLANGTPAEGQGVLDNDIPEDIDNESRTAFSATDIGADAGNYTYQDGDAPVLTHGSFLGQPVNSSFVYTVKITDNGAGVDTSGNNKPRMWFRKKFPAESAWASIPGYLVSGQLHAGVWGFHPDFAGAGVPVQVGDSLEYYFVAQDKGPVANVGFSNVTGTAHANVLAQTSAPVTPLKLLIYGIFPDTVYVGAAQQYPSLSNDGGFFQASKTNLFDTTAASLTVVITSDLVENGVHEYTNLNNSGAVIRIITNTAVEKIIRNQSENTRYLITLRKARNVTIDGSVNGSGRYLHFISGKAVPVNTLPVILIAEGSGISIKNCVFETNGTSTWGEAMRIDPNTTRLLIEGNKFTNIESSNTAVAGLPGSAIYLSIGSTDSVVIRQNEITNFGTGGIFVFQSGLHAGGRVIIDGNHFYHNSAIKAVKGRTVISINTSINCEVRNNYIGGSAPYCGGAPWQFTGWTSTTDYSSFRGIVVDGGNGSSIQGNTIQNIRFIDWGFSFRGIVTAGSSKIGTEKGNLIGSLTNDSSIYNKDNVIAISGQGSMLHVENNIIAGITAGYAVGIEAQGTHGVIRKNLVVNFKTTQRLATAGYAGMKLGVHNGVIEDNTIKQLIHVSETDGSNLYGLDVSPMIQNSQLLIQRNRIADLQTRYTGSTPQKLWGIRIGDGNFSLHNNQLNLTGGHIPAQVDIVGIGLETQNLAIAKGKVYYNTVRLAGTTLSNGNSYALLIANGTPAYHVRNNILYNERTGGTGKHLALADMNAVANPAWQAGAINYNLYVTSDPAFVCQYRTTGFVNLDQWRALSQGDNASYAVRVADVPVDSLFVAVADNDLNILTTSQRSWYVNGKGMPVDSVSGDFEMAAGVRSTTAAGGATDIGSDEFDTNTMPMPLLVKGDHVPGGREQLIVNGRTVAAIHWGTTGILPDLGEAAFYSGVWPNDTTNNGAVYHAGYLNGYWHIPATGGSNYTYSITFYYDSSMLGKVTDPANMVINKRQPGVPGSWEVIQPTVVDLEERSISVTDQTSFSEFTATDVAATLRSGVLSPDVLIVNQAVDQPASSTGSTITAAFTEFNQGQASAGIHKILFYLSPDDMVTPDRNGDLLLGELEVNGGVAVNTATGPLHKKLVIPCSVIPGNYNLLFVADGASQLKEMNEKNNVVSVPVTIAAGVTLPAKPVITASPAPVVCAPGIVTLSANNADCNGCTYSWSNGATGNTLSVPGSGTYTVTATNVCGAASASQVVTIKPTPTVLVTAAATHICSGDAVTLMANGAGTYNWTGAGLNATTGSVVKVTPWDNGTAVYTVTGTSDGCSASATVSVNISSTVTPSLQISASECLSGTVNFQATAVNAGSNPFYQWMVNNVNYGGGPEITVDNISNSTKVYCELTSGNYCANPRTVNATVTVSCSPTAVPDIDGMESYSLGPNPSRGLFEMKMTFNRLKQVRITIIDVNGKVVYRGVPFNVSGTVSKQIDLRHLGTGLYYLQVMADKDYFTDKLLLVR